MQFSSKPPFQKKYWDSDRSYYFVDRPQTNPTNRVLESLRITLDAFDSQPGWHQNYVNFLEMYQEDPELYGSLWGRKGHPLEDVVRSKESEREHALKVLRKWKAVYSEAD